MPRTVDVSVIVPLYNEERNICSLVEIISEALQADGKSFEIILVNDGSTDGSAAILEKIWQEKPGVIIINLFRRSGKAAALGHGFGVAQGRFVATIDADLQYDPHLIPVLVGRIEMGCDVVSAKRINRADPAGVVLTSKLFNKCVQLLTRRHFVDLFSGLKCYRSDVVRMMGLYGDLYRLAPIFAVQNGFRVEEYPVEHRRRIHGISKYTTPSRFKRAMTDLVVVAVHLVFDRTRCYYIGQLAWFLLGLGLCVVALPWFRRHSLEPPGVFLIFVGCQLLIIRQIVVSVFDRHLREHRLQQSNVRGILHGRARENTVSAVEG